jgi:hypothetical protein
MTEKTMGPDLLDPLYLDVDGGDQHVETTQRLQECYETPKVLTRLYLRHKWTQNQNSPIIVDRGHSALDLWQTQLSLASISR